MHQDRGGGALARWPTVLVVGGTLVILSPAALAQSIPWIVLPLVATPVVAVLLAAALGVAARSWLVGLGHTALVVAWVAWFVAASRHSTSDLLVWAPIAALALHSVAMGSYLAWRAVRRSKTRDPG